MKVKSLLAVGVLAPAITSAIVLVPVAHASAAPYQSEFSAEISCNIGSVSGETVDGVKCSGEPDGTYSNAFLAIQGGNGPTGGFACVTVRVQADGEAAQGTGCTLLNEQA